MDNVKQRCANRSSTTTVTGSKGEEYRVFVTAGDTGNSCDCKGFEFRGMCKHITAALLALCDWDENSGSLQSPQEEMEMKCPRCGGDTEMYTEMV